MRAMILAAGFGRRLRPHTESIAKPALPLLNIPMLGYSLYLLEQVGLRHLAINTHHQPDSVKKAIQELPDKRYSIDFYHESEQILGGAGGIKNAQASLKEAEEFFVLNGDNISLFTDPKPLEKMLAYHKEQGALATLMVYPHPEVGSKFNGAWADAQGMIHEFGKSPSDPVYTGHHVTGIYLLSSKILDWIPEGEANLVYDVLVPAIQSGEKVCAFPAGDIQWFETGNESDYLQTHWRCLELLNSSKDYGLKKLLDRFTPGWRDFSLGGFCSATNLSRMAGLDTEGHGLIGRHCQIGSDIRLENVVIGENCQIESGSRLKNVVLGPGTRIPENSSLSDHLISQ